MNKRRNPYAKALFDQELPFKHRVEKDAMTYQRKQKHEPSLEDYMDELEELEKDSYE